LRLNPWHEIHAKRKIDNLSYVVAGKKSILEPSGKQMNSSPAEIHPLGNGPSEPRLIDSLETIIGVSPLNNLERTWSLNSEPEVFGCLYDLTVRYFLSTLVVYQIYLLITLDLFTFSSYRK
jgi:hypothetical protein